MAEEQKPPFPLLDPYADTEAFSDPKATFQSKNHRVFTRNPSAREIGDGEIAFSSVNGVTKLHTKIRGILVSAVLT